jgi:propionyl-CoA synthetase
MRQIADCEEYRAPAAIEDPVVLDEVREAMLSIGYASSG